jgi:hypothetical protein
VNWTLYLLIVAGIVLTGLVGVLLDKMVNKFTAGVAVAAMSSTLLAGLTTYETNRRVNLPGAFGSNTHAPSVSTPMTPSRSVAPSTSGVVSPQPSGTVKPTRSMPTPAVVSPQPSRTVGATWSLLSPSHAPRVIPQPLPTSVRVPTPTLAPTLTASAKRLGVQLRPGFSLAPANYPVVMTVQYPTISRSHPNGEAGAGMSLEYFTLSNAAGIRLQGEYQYPDSYTKYYQCGGTSSGRCNLSSSYGATAGDGFYQYDSDIPSNDNLTITSTTPLGKYLIYADIINDHVTLVGTFTVTA